MAVQLSPRTIGGAERYICVTKEPQEISLQNKGITFAQGNPLAYP